MKLVTPAFANPFLNHPCYSVKNRFNSRAPPPRSHISAEEQRRGLVFLLRSAQQAIWRLVGSCYWFKLATIRRITCARGGFGACPLMVGDNCFNVGLKKVRV